MSKANLHTILQRIGQKVGLPDLSLDGDDYCLLRIGDTSLSIEFIEDGELAIFTTRCGTLPNQDRERALLMVAEANFYWTGSGGGTLSVNPRENTVHLQYREPTTQMDQDRLEKLLQAMVMNTESWADRLAAVPSPASAPAPQSASVPSMFLNRA